MMFHAQKENSMKPANKQLLDTEIIIIFMVGFASILDPELHFDVS